jgi:endoglucanase
MVKKIPTILGTAILALSTLGASAYAGTASADAPQDNADQTTKAAFSMKRCLNMGNALETPANETWGGRLNTAEDYQRIADAGFDTVRIPVRWSAYLNKDSNYTIHPEFAKIVDQNIINANKAGLNVILNVHHFDELMNNPGEQMARFRAIWDQISLRYSKLPDSVWFEVLNEPHTNLSGKAMRQLQAQAIAIIRRDNPERIIILGGEQYSNIRTLASNLAPPDDNIVYTFHYYDPFNFTHQEATWLGDATPKGKRGWGSKADKEELANAVSIAVAFRDAINRPVFLGEFGANDPIDNAERVEWAGAVKTAMEQANIPWCLWSYSNTFAAYKDESGWDQDMLKALTE